MPLIARIVVLLHAKTHKDVRPGQGRFASVDGSLLCRHKGRGGA